MGHLTRNDEIRIVKLIEEWSEPKLTWPLIVEACKSKLNINRARQSLMKLPAVHMAMKDRKAALKAPTEKRGWVKDILQANERIEKLTEANQRLKFINQQLLARFLTWQANADMHGITQTILDRPLVQFRR
ncbi:hypothetical protein YA0850_32245 [Pseudomonas veronii]|uniref:Transposase n=1 Tax=Pseudomonas veronii TaxID=76761 RepID=A0ABS0VQW4_PSEVE|nr:hypothetical protein [Pseudomonas veronii]MBI6557020.1 hypothetical protein [Pseudomonas veronii]MBI6653932.1 hypothetical protein [Pseudomonas veronii]